MDTYVIVAELELPPGKLALWLETPRNATPSFAALVDGAEGDVVARVEGDRLSLRMCLIDAAFFAIADHARAAFAQARTLGGRGRWYVGDHVSGKLALVDGPERSAALARAPEEIRRWANDAAELGARSMAGEVVPRAWLGRESASASGPLKKAATKKAATKKAATKKAATKKAATKKAATKKAATKKASTKKPPTKSARGTSKIEHSKSR